MGQRAALEIVASARTASPPSRIGFPDAVRELPRAVSIVTFRSGPEWLGLTATSVSSLSVDPPTILLSFDRATTLSPNIAAEASFGVSILSASQAELANQFARGAPVAVEPRPSTGSWTPAPSGVILRSDAIAAFECQSEELIERHERAIVIARVRTALSIGGPGALVYWRGGYNPIGWTDDEVRRAVGLFPIS